MVGKNYAEGRGKTFEGGKKKNHTLAKDSSFQKKGCLTFLA